MAQVIEIDLNEEFRHLARAPIVEAVIHWQARSDEVEKAENAIRSRLIEYPSHQTQRTATFTIFKSADSASPSTSDRWHGFRLTSEDGRNIARFTRDGFAFSRIAPYENWERFANEAKRLWRVFVEHTHPVQVDRLGVRFINRVSPVSIDTLGGTLRLSPQIIATPLLPLSEFLNRSLYDVPGHPYRTSVTQTTQPPVSSGDNSLALIVDIDVFLTETLEPQSNSLERKLEEMRWIKNKIFFSVFSDAAINRFSETKR